MLGPQAAAGTDRALDHPRVTFVTGTLVLGDTLNRTFNGLIGNVYQHVSFEVRGKAEFSDSGAGSVDGTSNRKAVPESVIGTIRGIPGVQFAYGSVSGYAQMIAPDGKVIGHSGQALGFSFDPNPQLSALKLVQGHAPSASDDVGIDKATADKYPLQSRPTRSDPAVRSHPHVHDHRRGDLRQRQQPRRDPRLPPSIFRPPSDCSAPSVNSRRSHPREARRRQRRARTPDPAGAAG